MSQKQQAMVVMAVAIVGQAYLGKVARQQAAMLGLPVLAASLIGLAVSARLK
ncbi:hypothetical protein [Streptomyces sp. NPDC002328]|uniref:hypothetical protein n=1 Tax=Streptomyces sp. NPDC002328 TaxID=3364642 RepID=UPI0036B4A398